MRNNWKTTIIHKVPTADRRERRRQEGIVEGIPEAQQYALDRIKKFRKQGYIEVRDRED